MDNVLDMTYMDGIQKLFKDPSAFITGIIQTPILDDEIKGFSPTAVFRNHEYLVFRT
jgi:hypothetical protein